MFLHWHLNHFIQYVAYYFELKLYFEVQSICYIRFINMLSELCVNQTPGMQSIEEHTAKQYLCILNKYLKNCTLVSINVCAYNIYIYIHCITLL